MHAGTVCFVHCILLFTLKHNNNEMSFYYILFSWKPFTLFHNRPTWYKLFEGRCFYKGWAWGNSEFSSKRKPNNAYRPFDISEQFPTSKLLHCRHTFLITCLFIFICLLEQETTLDLRRMVFRQEAMDDNFNRQKYFDHDWIRNTAYNLLREYEANSLVKEHLELWSLVHIWSFIDKAFENLEGVEAVRWEFLKFCLVKNPLFFWNQ